MILHQAEDHHGQAQITGSDHGSDHRRDLDRDHHYNRNSPPFSPYHGRDEAKFAHSHVDHEHDDIAGVFPLHITAVITLGRAIPNFTCLYL